MLPKAIFTLINLVCITLSSYVAVDGPVDYVFHFASPASPIDYLKLPIQTLKVGSLGTHKALGLAKSKKARFLLASTSECYGDPLVHPLTIYAEDLERGIETAALEIVVETGNRAVEARDVFLEDLESRGFHPVTAEAHPRRLLLALPRWRRSPR